MKLALLIGLTAAAPSFAAAQEAAELYGACFSRSLDASELQQSRDQRVARMAIRFQGFDGSLLAAMTYQLRYGTTFSVSAECVLVADQTFECRACGADRCSTESERFKLRWSGGDAMTLLNDETGILAENKAGGRDRLPPGGANRDFELKRSAPDACTW